MSGPFVSPLTSVTADVGTHSHVGTHWHGRPRRSGRISMQGFPGWVSRAVGTGTTAWAP